MGLMIDQKLAIESRMPACTKGFAPHMSNVETERGTRAKAPRRLKKVLNEYRERDGEKPARCERTRGGDHYDPRLFYFRALIEHDRIS